MDALRKAVRARRPGILLAVLAAAAMVVPRAGTAFVAAPPSSAATKDSTELVFYPVGELAQDQRGDYYANLLKLVLSKADEPFQAHPTVHASGINRAFTRMAQGDGVDVMWAPATEQLDRDFLRVRLPLDKGILGWRLFLVRAEDIGKFAAIRNIGQLKAHTAGQVSEWVDTEILTANSVPVVKTMRYQDIFNMLAARRFDYLPRGVAEIRSEAASYAHMGLAVETRVALHYPMCSYFYVARGNKRLAQQLEAGLRRATKDGSFEQLFRQFNEPALQAAALNKREVFELTNPYAPQGPRSGAEDCAAASASILKVGAK